MEERVSALEETLTATITLLKEVIRSIEVERGEDIDGDGVIHSIIHILCKLKKNMIMKFKFLVPLKF